jgi:hypothetical protein
MVVVDPKKILFFIFSSNFFSNFWSSKPWIRIVIQPKMLDPDPYQIEYGYKTLTVVTIALAVDIVMKGEHHESRKAIYRH